MPSVRKSNKKDAKKDSSKDRHALERSILTHPVRHYKSGDRFNFVDYFYPPELAILESNDFEEFNKVKKRTDAFFTDEHDLKAFQENITDPSSNNEDRPPASEEAFFQSGEEDIFRDIAATTGYIPPLSRMQRNLLRSIERYAFDAADNVKTTAFKRDKRLALVRGFCKDLKRKRYARAFRRYRKTRTKQLNIGAEALDLMEQELIDKQLNRKYYYEASEPPEYTTLLLPARRNAIKEKFRQHLIDPVFRRAYRNRMYLNVNMDVPADDVHNMGCELWTRPSDSSTEESQDSAGPRSKKASTKKDKLKKGDRTQGRRRDKDEKPADKPPADKPLANKPPEPKEEPRKDLPPLVVPSDLFSWTLNNVNRRVKGGVDAVANIPTAQDVAAKPAKDVSEAALRKREEAVQHLENDITTRETVAEKRASDIATKEAALQKREAQLGLRKIDVGLKS